MTAAIDDAQTLKDAVGRSLAEGRGDTTLRDIAARLGTSHVHLVELEGGGANPTLERLARIARVYGGHFEIDFVLDFDE